VGKRPSLDGDLPELGVLPSGGEGLAEGDERAYGVRAAVTEESEGRVSGQLCPTASPGKCAQKDLADLVVPEHH
jgi:hypothetical protein